MNISTMEFLRAYWVFTLSRSRCSSIELKQENQATIHHGSLTWIPYFGLETNSVRRFLWYSCSVSSRLLSFFFCTQAQHVCSQWTQTGKPTDDFSCFFNLNPPLQLGPSREDIFKWIVLAFRRKLGWSNVYNIHSMIHCCSTLELIFLSKRNQKTIRQEIHFPHQYTDFL